MGTQKKKKTFIIENLNPYVLGDICSATTFQNCFISLVGMTYIEENCPMEMTLQIKSWSSSNHTKSWH